MIQPNEMKTPRPMHLHHGVIATTTDVWNMLTASRDGDLRRVQALAAQCPALLTCQYDYTYGARVPDMSKWAKEYYFKNYDSAVFLLENGMNPNHMNWRHVTLLHDLAFKGELRKVQLLLDYGAEINPIDEEFCSTPLGFAARWGRRDVVALLIERGADVNKAGAPWAM